MELSARSPTWSSSGEELLSDNGDEDAGARSLTPRRWRLPLVVVSGVAVSVVGAIAVLQGKSNASVSARAPAVQSDDGALVGQKAVTIARPAVAVGAWPFSAAPAPAVEAAPMAATPVAATTLAPLDPAEAKLQAAALEHLCNPVAALSGPVHPRKLHITGEWAEKCMNLKHEGIWEPPEEWGKRNWCWVYMRTEANAERFKKYLHRKPENWWGVQAECARHDKAPVPEDQVLYALQHHEICDRPSAGTWDELRHEHAGVDWDEAGSWFGRNVDVYIINLPTNVARLQRIANRLKELNIDWKHLDGVDMRPPGSLEKAKKDGLVPESYDMDVVHKNLKAQYEQSKSGYAKDAITQIGLGTVGCSAAHLRAMRTAARGKKPLALILEDDTNLVDGFLLKLHTLVREELPCDWQAVNLDMYEPYGKCVSPHLLRVQPDGNEPPETCRQGGSWNFGSVLYKVSELDFIADRLSAAVWNVSRPSCLVHDITFASLSDEIVYYAVPAQQYPGIATTFPKLMSDVDREAINQR
eukprot:TRINITY_DN5427_c0_g2_i1.p1 TRINITY_DN5427_c0_g2~~TRINITY_DN5427_c0_g2_i1.p1  ORF type:complete len:527 (-),score=105.77 TRINITY_DN5427_c0_g2_i1:77-1657(-)